MAFTSGFFNSLRGDRKYNAEQVSEIFDGILKDGIIPGYGQLFDVNTANNGMQITVGTGRAWFDHTWSKNDSVMVLTVPLSDITRGRYDTVVLEVNHEEMTRANSIKIVQGEPAVNPVKPTLVNTDKIKQYPLAHILVKAGAEEIKAEDIENMVGRTPTVFATGILETAPIDDLWSQWEGEWHTWFEGIKLQLSGDVVTNLQLQIDRLDNRVTKIEQMVKIETITHTNIITSSGVWTNDSGQEIIAKVMCFGGGGGGSGNRSAEYPGGGGGGGHMSTASITLAPNASVNVTIGTAGTNATTSGYNPTNGGTTSFGTYLSANGGGAGGSNGSGGSGGTGGGGGACDQYGNYAGKNHGGDGSYGGGGGGGGGALFIASSARPERNGISGGNGGNGGTYGGGGGGGGGSGAVNYFASSEQTVVKFTGGSYGYGGAGGAKGGNGGHGGTGGNDKDIVAGDAVKGNAGTNTDILSGDLDFKGFGAAGIAGNNSAPVIIGRVAANGGPGGGGGGGYGGIGGKGGDGTSASTTSSTSTHGSGGGGGGGYGAYGANGGTNGAGGGGGGYGGGGYIGNNYCGGGGGGYGSNNFGAGGTFGVAVNDAPETAPKAGCIVITYTTTELVVG